MIIAHKAHNLPVPAVARIQHADQRAKGARADIGTADQAQPIDPLLVR
jgi:hypothetical protein